MYFSLCLTILVISAAAAFDILPPIPSLSEDRGLRFPLNATASGKVVLETFIELNCPDSAAAFPVLKRVVEHYGPQNVELRVNQLPLPYHRNAFVSTQGLFV